MKLNADQLSVVENVYGPVLVLAPAGTGKTTILAERIVRAIQNEINPERMLCLTFTNLAAKQLRDRVSQLVGDSAGQIWMGTFHGFCAMVLYKEARAVGLPSDYVIYDEEDDKELIREICTQTGFLREEDHALMRFDSAKSHARDSELVLDGYPVQSLEHPYDLLYQRYSDEMRRRHALDFSDLIYYVRAMFSKFASIRNKWRHRFDFIQIDEIQDTHLAEYEVIKSLAGIENIAFFGDLDQSIYGWRGAEPLAVRERIMVDFVPKVINLDRNYRSTKTLLLAADSFGRSFRRRFTRLIPDDSCLEGDKIQIHHAENQEGEAEWICDHIRELACTDGKSDFRDVAILCRTNNLSSEIGKVLKRREIPCVTVDQYQFFRRQEIKDALSFLKLILNPYDISAGHRVSLRFVKGLGKKVLQDILSKTQDAGIFLPDFFDIDTLNHDDPFGRLLDHYSNRSMIVLDTETTGLTPLQDNIIQIAYQRLHRGQPGNQFNKYLKSSISVGSAFYVHGISDEYLSTYGEEPADVFQQLRLECAGHLVVGHNVKYDLNMLYSHARRCGINFEHLAFEDTYEIARRLIRSDSYRLEDLCRVLGLHAQPSHNALNDVLATVELVQRLIPIIIEGHEHRKEIITQYKHLFEEYAVRFKYLRKLSYDTRPAGLLQYVMEEFGLLNYYRSEEARLSNLEHLLQIFADHDRTDLDPVDALHVLVQYVSLARNVDHLLAKSNRVLVAPIHQSKGLEFRSVFIAGAVDGFIPLFRAKDKEEEEEKRLFYVAMTRAKERLFITGFKKYKWFGKELTRYIDYIDKAQLFYPAKSFR